MDTRAAATHARLKLAAFDLFEERGYHAVTVEDIAAAAGVSHMTFFRHFAAKDRVLLDDPFDPIVAEAVAAQSADLPAIERVGRGLLTAGESLGEEITETSRRGIAIAATVPELGAGIAANSAATEQAIVDRAAPPGREVETRIAAAACLAGITARLLDWAASGTTESLGELVAEAIYTVVPSLASTDGPGPADAPDRAAGA